MQNVLDQLTYFAFLQCVLLIILYGVSKNKERQFNPYLLLLVSVLFLGLIGKIGYQHPSVNWSRRMTGLSEFSFLFFGPVVYLFTQSVLSEKKWEKSDIAHFLPGLIYVFIILFYYMLPPAEVINERLKTGELIRVVRILIGLGLTYNLAYFIFTFLAFRKRKTKLQEESSYILNINFIQNFLLAIGTIFLLWTCFYVIGFFGNDFFEISARNWVWLTLVILVLLITYFQMAKPEAFSFQQQLNSSKYAQSKLSHQDLGRLKKDLDQIMIDQKPYLNKQLLKAELAELLGISSPEMARLLNEQIGMNFFEYVNYYRIKEFIQLAKAPDHANKTLAGIAEDAGFRSKATFNKSFKQIMGCPPSIYLKK